MSYRHCGYAIVKYDRPTPESSEIKLLDTGLVETSPCESKNIEKIHDEISQIQRFIIEIRAVIEGADEVVVEMPLGSQNAISAKYLGYCYAAVAAIELNATADFIYISPFDLKLWSGKKKNTKEHVRDMVIRRLGRLVTTKNDNIIDALGICLLQCDRHSRKAYEAIKQISDIEAQQEELRSGNPAAGVVQPAFKFMSSD